MIFRKKPHFSTFLVIFKMDKTLEERVCLKFCIVKKICDALREKDPKCLIGNFRERKEQASGLDSVSDIPDSLPLILSPSQRPCIWPLLAT